MFSAVFHTCPNKMGVLNALTGLYSKSQRLCVIRHAYLSPGGNSVLNILFTYMYNRTPIICLKHKTPYEAINRSKPDVSHLRVLGCGAYVFLHEDIWQDTLSPHAELMTFIGLMSSVKGWKFM